MISRNGTSAILQSATKAEEGTEYKEKILLYDEKLGSRSTLRSYLTLLSLCPSQIRSTVSGAPDLSSSTKAALWKIIRGADAHA